MDATRARRDTQLAQEVRDGTELGKETFRQQLLDLIEVKRGHRDPAGITQYLPTDVLAPFDSTIEPAETGKHVGNFLKERAETTELTDSSLRR